ncbi:MAG: aminomethyl-transferring glycine dehydrogenase subunit GcvPA [Candidatus Azotimanducaceae bacterium]|uniref:Probable glycine dehydrogenase (decarboxylating) subunit 1 n=1 Tax=OM182 bacterium TaxID=2510334 RepID=A0A520S5I4_9GAMM|nr:MAG: aminomethyl-transferring glycine dehydrogenase subunit GcvPA [OM182 bacterium]
MPFIPHTLEDERRMLETIDVASIDSLFDEIPKNLSDADLQILPSGISEMAMLRLMSERAAKDTVTSCFLGAGAYDHHIPSVVWDIAARGEFLTAYTPYQAEASQGTLQLIYEFQTMISRLTAMDVANASVYDGATALAEALLMAVRANKKSQSRRLLCASTVHPGYLATCRTIVSNQDIEIDLIPYVDSTGTIDSSALDYYRDQDYAGLVIPYPNFFGGLEHIDALTNWAHEKEILVIGVVNPLALALFRAPGDWGEEGADIVVGEAQPFGIPMCSGGPYLGYMCCRKSLVRQLPGRIIGRTVDFDGKEGFALTLQAREQHIRRAKATSNICTNQGLLVTAATIYLSLLGQTGLASVAAVSHNNIVSLKRKVSSIIGVSVRFSSPVFHEAVFQLPKPASHVLHKMAEKGILGGYDLGQVNRGLSNCILTNTTEKKNDSDLEFFTDVLREAIKEC